MYFESLSSLLNMGGHAVYVWSAYALTVIVILYNQLEPVFCKKRVIRQIYRQMHQYAHSKGLQLKPRR
ncbi:hypothetical protein CI610_01000 [invertebrate metagenome]|uniref:Cytochrome c-type biogenesis protein CcmD n=1 Tax=invertebrate metagenome TaxID=1711999 RepID=A0A2H9T9Z6_9ZZZZ